MGQSQKRCATGHCRRRCDNIASAASSVRLPKTGRKIILILPRIHERGPPPRIVVPKNLLAALSDRGSTDAEVARKLLEYLYWQEKNSISQMGRLFGVQADTVRRWMQRLKIKRKKRADVVSYALTKYPKFQFSGNRLEKAYLLGLRTGDIAVQKHGRGLRASISTSHPSMIALFCKCFGKYNKVGVYPKKESLHGWYHWSAYSVLDSSFDFLREKVVSLSSLGQDRKMFFSFLAGYFDAEGCISLHHRKDGNSASFIIKSCDEVLLQNIVKKLETFGFEPKFRLAKRAGNVPNGISYSKDYWGIILSHKNVVADVLNELPLRHSEKIRKRALLSTFSASGWLGAAKQIELLKRTIHEEVRGCIKSGSMGTRNRSEGIKSLEVLLRKVDNEWSEKFIRETNKPLVSDRQRLLHER